MSRYIPGRQKPTIDVRLPEGFSQRFIDDLLSMLDGMDSRKAQYQKAAMLTQYRDGTTVPPSVRRKAAIDKWLGSERRNSITNQRLLMSYDMDFGWATLDRILSVARGFIVDVIGPCAPYPEVLNLSVHTNGASPRIRRFPTSAVEKLRGKAQISEAAVKHWLQMANSTMLSAVDLQLRETSVLFTVPKKTEIDRAACKEPECNSLLQRSIGIFFARRLRKAGIDLRDQTRNQELARVAVKQHLATIDLSSASDSITTQLVYMLLPWDWFCLLDDLRVHRVVIEKDIHELEMFSSMGNGFTFELETLIFWALTRSVCYLSSVHGQISVYGDDIIAPSAIVRRLKRVFSYVGFTTNAKKTFYRGPYRESCGKHYHNGYDVSPFYIREEITTVDQLILTLNQLLEWDGRGYGFFISEEPSRFHKRWSTFVSPHLYGGLEPVGPNALCTGHTPRWRLQPDTRSVRYTHKRSGKYLKESFPEDAAYLLWHLVRDRVHDVFEIDPSLVIGLKVARHRTYGAVTSWRPYIQGWV